MSVLKFVKIEENDEFDIILKFLILNWVLVFFLLSGNNGNIFESISVSGSFSNMFSGVKVLLRELILVVIVVVRFEIVVNKRGLSVKNNIEIYVSGWLDYSIIFFNNCLV